MILLNENSENPYVSLTLSENVSYTASPVYFLFRFVSDTTNEELLFTGTDLSDNIVRYNRFNIICTGSSSQILTASTISLNPKGTYRYEVYEQLSQTNLFLSGTSGIILEKGFVKLSGTTDSIINGSYTGASMTYSYYDY